MKFDIKDMYSFLLSHTFPGFVVLIELLFFIYFFIEPNFLEITKHAAVKSPILFIIVVYVVSTLFGFIVDGIRHFSLEDFIGDKYEVHFMPNLELIRKDIKQHALMKHAKINNEIEYLKYKHFYEDDLWYPYEAYGNIFVSLISGFPIIFYYLFWASPANRLVSFISLAVYVVIILIMYYEAKQTFHECTVEIEAFLGIEK
jgi:hypothetical protein